MKHKHKPRKSLEFKLRKLKTALVVVSFTLAGILLMMLNGWIAEFSLDNREWLRILPVSELGGTFFGARLLNTLFEYSSRKDQEEATVEQFCEIVKEQVPDMHDVVIEGFAAHPEDLKRVASLDPLDNIASNVMSLRLGDEQFAREICTDIRDQAIRAIERWHDVDVRIQLSSALEGSTFGTPLSDVTVEWEYAAIPSNTVRRFAYMSDRDEYRELLPELSITSPWPV